MLQDKARLSRLFQFDKTLQALLLQPGLSTGNAVSLPRLPILVEGKAHARYASWDSRIHNKYYQIETSYGAQIGLGLRRRIWEMGGGRE